MVLVDTFAPQMFSTILVTGQYKSLTLASAWAQFGAPMLDAIGGTVGFPQIGDEGMGGYEKELGMLSTPPWALTIDTSEVAVK